MNQVRKGCIVINFSPAIMGIAYKSFKLLIAVLLLVSITIPNPASSKELVGIVPFANQRDNPTDNWIGFYIQARLQAYLSENLDCDFHTLSTIRLWQYRANDSVPISVGNTILISGSFQVVLEQGIVELVIKRFSPESKQQSFEISFSSSEIETKLDQLNQSVAQWIDPNANLDKPFNYLRYPDHYTREAFQLRENLYSPRILPQVGTVLRLGEEVTTGTPPELIGDLVEGMISVLSELTGSEKTAILEKAERVLRTAAMKYIENSRVHSLLAEVFYLNKKNPEWVEKTANQAQKLDAYNELAILMQILAKTETDGQSSSLIRSLNDVNPWIWPDDTNDNNEIQFQKGIYRSELQALSESLQ